MWKRDRCAAVDNSDILFKKMLSNRGGTVRKCQKKQEGIVFSSFRSLSQAFGPLMFDSTLSKRKG